MKPYRMANKMKKILSLVSAIALVVSLSACNSGKNIPASTVPEPVAPDEISSSLGESDTESEEANGNVGSTDVAAEQIASGLLGGLLKSKIPAKSLVSKFFIPVIENGIYTLELKVTYDNSSYDTVISSRNENFSMETTMDGTAVQMIHRADVSYLCIPKDAFMNSVKTNENSEELIALLDTLGISSSSGIVVEISETNSNYDSYKNSFTLLLSGMNQKLTYVKSGKVKKGKAEYICEEFKTADASVKYYFSGETLKFIETQKGQVKIQTTVKSISPEADSTSFNLPIDYIDITSLYNVYG